MRWPKPSAPRCAARPTCLGQEADRQGFGGCRSERHSAIAGGVGRGGIGLLLSARCRHDSDRQGVFRFRSRPSMKATWCRCSSRPMPRTWRRGLQHMAPQDVLEIAAGTGAVTAELLKRLPRGRHHHRDRPQPGDARCGRRASSPTRRDPIRRACDAQQLALRDESFDAVVCQFGAMFFPDKLDGLSRGAARAARRRASISLSVWDDLDSNPFAGGGA